MQAPKIELITAGIIHQQVSSHPWRIHTAAKRKISPIKLIHAVAAGQFDQKSVSHLFIFHGSSCFSLTVLFYDSDLVAKDKFTLTKSEQLQNKSSVNVL